MRSLVFVALLGLALAVPVPHDMFENSLESEFFEASELDPDCYSDETLYEHGGMEEDLIIENIEEEISSDDCDDEPIDEEKFMDIEIDIAPANDEDSVIYENVAAPEYDEECEDDVITEAPFTVAPQPETDAPTPDNNADCYADESDPVDNFGYDGSDDEYIPIDENVDPLDEFSHSFVEIDQVFEVENEGDAQPVEECIEY